jgi:hypothetical protein
MEYASMKHTINESDRALQFAQNWRYTNKFCGKVAKQFDLLGYISERQVEVLQEIEEQQRRAFRN